MTPAHRVALAAVVLVAVAATALVATIAIATTGQASDAERDRAASLAAADSASPALQAAREDCVAAPQAYGVTESGSLSERRGACTTAVSPDPSWYLGRPPLQPGAVAAYDVLLLGLVLTGLAGALGLIVGAGSSGGGAAPTGRAALAGAALAGVGAAVLWGAVAIALADRGLPLPGPEAPLQVLRVALLGAVVAAAAAAPTQRLGAAPTLFVATLVGGLSLVSPISVLDLAGLWIQGRV